MSENERSPSWWTTIPGTLTAIAGLLTAVTGFILALNQVGLIDLRGKDRRSPTQSAGTVSPPTIDATLTPRRESPDTGTKPTQLPRDRPDNQDVSSVKSPRPIPINDIWNFRATDVSDKALEIAVDYVYNGGYGTGQRYVYMSAVALQRDGSQVPNTHFEGLGGPGEISEGNGTSKMLIQKYDDSFYSSETVRICMMARVPFSEVLCKAFPHLRTWR